MLVDPRDDLYWGITLFSLDDGSWDIPILESTLIRDVVVLFVTRA